MGDLADILRATGSNTSTDDWQFQTTTMMSNCDTLDEFGNPFTHFKDPLIDNNNNVVSSNDEFNFKYSSSSSSIVEGFGKFGTVTYHERPNIFSRMLQINPDPKLQLIPRHNSPLVTSTPVAAVTPPKVLNNNNNNTMIFPNRCNGVQISSPRNTAIKRRKSQAKKVVCIPAPAPANSRPSSGEIVPSDLWAWRKYGQKPIKGSPYPRGYYRCSSSKGCPARKQVERSRTDPNMLVITYTSEHNHPWPTQRNALAGSTRSQQAAIKNTNPTPKNVPILQAQDPLDSKQEKHKEKNELGPVKREMDTDHLEMDDPDFEDGYNPEMPDGLNLLPEDSFFADLGEIETDPLDLIFDSLGYDYWTGCNGGATSSAHYTPSFYGEDKRDS